ncbi:MAG: RNA pseudouridine synthase, partial [Bacilli bacterium]
FAKTSKAASRLSEQIRNGQFKKRYLALVHGKFNEQVGKLENYLSKNEETHISRISNPTDGKLAILEYKVVSYDPLKDLTLLEIDLHTGRHHQIRVQLSYINHPIYGDQKYGRDVVGIQIHLWASKISFKHPVKDENMTFESIPSWRV